MKIYFAGAIRGGRQKIEDYKKMIQKLEQYGEVLTKHIADENITSKGEENLSQEQIYKRDIDWLNESDIMVADISIPSLGVGYEIGYAESLKKKIICLYENNSSASLSAMVGGNNNINTYRYNDIEEVLKTIEKALNEIE